MPKEAVERRLVGAGMWKDEIRWLIRAEEEEVNVIDELAERENDIGKLRLYVTLNGRKVGKVNRLHELLRYEERNKP